MKRSKKSVLLGCDTMEELHEAVEEAGFEASKDIVEEIRQEYIRNALAEEQGAPGLAEHVTEVEQRRDEHGRFIGEFTFRVEHPFAPLHEKGGHIEPSYSKAKVMGWTRDEMYQSLEDCNEYVTRKNLLRNAIHKVR